MREQSIHDPAYWRRWLPWGIVVVVAGTLQLALALNTRAPFVIPSGDNGSILSIIAYWLEPQAFARDALLGVEGSTSFYQAALMWPNYLLGLGGAPVGLFFILLCFPVALAQMAGFFVLGRHLFRNDWAALGLALISLPTVFTLAGDLWGLSSSPLYRSAYGAALPWLICLLILPRRPRPFALMVAAAAATYLHLPSGPPVALILLLVSFLRRQPDTSIPAALVQHLAAGFSYLLLMAPMALVFSQNFAAGDPEAMGAFRNSAYGSVAVAIDQLLSLRGPERMGILVSRVPGLEWTRSFVPLFFGAVFVSGSLALLFLCAIWMAPQSLRCRLRLSGRESWLWISVLFVGIAVFVIGASALDQAIAYANDRAPVQIDFIRATRFMVPGAYLGVFFALSWALAGKPGTFAAVSLLLATIVWTFAYPSTNQGIYRLTKGQGIEDESLTQFGRFAEAIRDMDDVDLITPVLRHDYLTSALRYISYKPLAFNRKDNNFITYSGQLDARGHRALMDQIDAIRRARREPATQAVLIDEFAAELRAPVIAIDRRVVPAEAEEILLRQFKFSLRYEEGPFALYTRFVE